MHYLTHVKLCHELAGRPRSTAGLRKPLRAVTGVSQGWDHSSKIIQGVSSLTSPLGYCSFWPSLIAVWPSP
eukprot:2018143-Pyramimonas_sp.AAC.1